MKYIVTYDLNQPTQDYPGLIEALKELSYAHVMYSVWFIDTTSNAEDIFDYLSPFIDNNDSLFISEISGWYAKMPQAGIDFLNR